MSCTFICTHKWNVRRAGEKRRQKKCAQLMNCIWTFLVMIMWIKLFSVGNVYGWIWIALLQNYAIVYKNWIYHAQCTNVCIFLMFFFLFCSFTIVVNGISLCVCQCCVKMIEWCVHYTTHTYTHFPFSVEFSTFYSVNSVWYSFSFSKCSTTAPLHL